ncbi:TPM domain-containing protein [Flavicella sp.]|uniref:TPM domain-containing protein n=1 Tax=Flavicella sp. TaxID=2957742 RepID=UPI0026345772|nr:TPM domain-containing protein [Flavicella sp.]MDG1806050.1 TPM domain-containing protein [Flavicella sp.]MDG2279270.1 TPM domain-containing protein [Flavicella sp.]
MPNTEYHLSEQEELDVVEAIKSAELNTSGEIRVHIDPSSDKDGLERAKEVFFELKMNETEAQNGVLFYLAVKEHKFAILGDAGIDKVVPDDFWNSTKELVIGEFKKGDFATGLQLGIAEAGKRLKEFFPYQKDDINELPDEISKG